MPDVSSISSTHVGEDIDKNVRLMPKKEAKDGTAPRTESENKCNDSSTKVMFLKLDKTKTIMP
ncbi:hypothetical protein Hanom_Chr06g00495901 [Helianthus anomalus]